MRKSSGDIFYLLGCLTLQFCANIHNSKYLVIKTKCSALFQGCCNNIALKTAYLREQLITFMLESCEKFSFAMCTSLAMF